jgi:hypothetical protein
MWHRRLDQNSFKLFATIIHAQKQAKVHIKIYIIYNIISCRPLIEKIGAGGWLWWLRLKVTPSNLYNGET